MNRTMPMEALNPRDSQQMLHANQQPNAQHETMVGFGGQAHHPFYASLYKPKEFEVVDKIFQTEMEGVEKKLKEESPQKLKKMNASVEQRVHNGTVELSGKLSRFEGLDKDAERYVLQKSKEKLQTIQDKVEKTYASSRAEDQNRSIIKVNNKVLSLDPSQSQREIYNGRFTLEFSSQMPLKMQIIKYAGEQIAFHLHKKRDFLKRLDRHKRGLASENDDDLFFQELLNELAREDEALDSINKKQAERNL